MWGAVRAMRGSGTDLVVDENSKRAECVADDVTLETGVARRGLAIGSPSIHRSPGLIVTGHADHGAVPGGVVGSSNT
jgi:hypothetical protein